MQSGQCITCKHMGLGLTCDAFLGAIPDKNGSRQEALMTQKDSALGRFVDVPDPSVRSPLCMGCKHLHIKDIGNGRVSWADWKCDAFPDGIPDRILDGEKHFESENGEVTFEWR